MFFFYFSPFTPSRFIRSPLTCRTHHGQDHFLRNLPLLNPHSPHYLRSRPPLPSEICQWLGMGLTNTRGDLSCKSLTELAALVGTIYRHQTGFFIFPFLSCPGFPSNSICTHLTFNYPLIPSTNQPLYERSSESNTVTRCMPAALTSATLPCARNTVILPIA